MSRVLNLTIAVQSSNHQIVPPDKVICYPSNMSTIAHEPESLTLTIHPMPDAHGSVKISITVTDEQDHISERSFLLTVMAVNDAPIISDIASVTVYEDTRNHPISFTIVDADGDLLRLSAISNNTQLIADADIYFQTTNPVDTDPGKQKIVNVTISTQKDAFGSAQITFTVTDPSGKWIHPFLISQ